MLERESLLAPIAAAEPSGPLLEYDPAFLALAEAARGKPEQRMGESVIAAEPPDWGKVERDAVALLGRTKDLRIAVLLVKARLHRGGLVGLAEGLAVTRGLIERHWETLYPQLDAEEDHDPAMRNNALAEVADAETIHAVREAEVASARGVGRVRVRDLEPQGGNGATAAAAGDEKPPPVEAVLAATDAAGLGRIAEAAAAAVADARAVEEFVKQKAGPARGPSLAKLTALLQRVASVLGARVAAAQGEPGTAAEDASAEGGRPLAARSPGAIGSRDDVLAALDAICAYYERKEPSSPIPLLMRRSKRLVAASFIDIVRDLMPDAAAQAEGLRGKTDASGEEAGGPTSNEGGGRT
jgi:type VI secretion system protein ImpA